MYSKKHIKKLAIAIVIALSPNIGNCQYPFEKLIEDCNKSLKITQVLKDNDYDIFTNIPRDEIAQYGTCLGYLNGIIAHEEIYVVARKNKRIYCLPDNYDYKELIYMILANEKYIDKELRKNNAAWAVNNILTEKFQCKKENEK